MARRKESDEADGEAEPLLAPVAEGNGARISYGTNAQQRTSIKRNISSAEIQEASEDERGATSPSGNAPESLDYEMIQSTLHDERWRSQSRMERFQYNLFKWIFALLIACCTGTTAFLINMAVENIGGLKFGVITYFTNYSRYVEGFLVMALSNILLVVAAAALCQFISMEAAGSGIPEVKAYLNGVDAPRIFAPKTLFVKVLGSIGSVAGGLAVGKEGPLVHTGACFANILGQGGSRKYHLTAKWLRFFKNDSDRRDLVTCGAAAGVAAAFRAPVGGVLFALEEVTSWWRSSLLWRVFFTNAVVAIVVRALMKACEGGKCGSFSSGGFIIFNSGDAVYDFGFLELLPVTILGIVGGFLGSLFNYLNLSVNRFRQRWMPKKAWVRITEAAAISLLTSAVRYGTPFLIPCRPCPADHPQCPSLDEMSTFRAFTCPKNHYNDMAGLLFSTNDDTIKNLFSTGTGDVFTYQTLFLYFVIFYTISFVTFGITVPSGLFVPSIICGATYGRVAGMIMTKIAGSDRIDQGMYALLGAASFLGGTMRMTVSLSVILLELTGSLKMLPLIMFALLVSKTVGDMFNEAIYDTVIQLKRMPYLEARPEAFMNELSAKDAILYKPVTLAPIENVGRLQMILTETLHNAYPVVGEPEEGFEACFHGLVLRRHLLVLLQTKKCFQADKQPASPSIALEIPFDEFGKPGSGKGLKISDVDLTDEHRRMHMDLRPFANRSCFVVTENMTLSKVYALFRQLGLRHLCVVPPPSHVVGIITRKDLLPSSFADRRVARHFHEETPGVEPFLV